MKTLKTSLKLLLIFLVTFQVYQNIVFADFTLSGTISGGEFELKPNSTVCFNPNFNGQALCGTIQDGKFDLTVPSNITGDYRLSELRIPRDSGGEDYIYLPSLGVKFSVANGALTDGNANIVVPDHKVSGTLQKESSQGLVDLTNVYIQITRLNGNDSFGFSTLVKDGKFSEYMPDGQYEFNSYYIPDTQSSVTLSGSFTIANGQPTNLADLAVIEKKPNVVGTVKKETDNGVQNIASGSAYIYNQGTNKTIGAAIKDGAFQLYLSDGNYILNSIVENDTQENTQVQILFSIVNSVYKGVAPLNVLLKKPNISGTVKKLVDGDLQPYNNVTFNFSPTKPGGINHMATVKEGAFSVYLEDGTYIMNNFYDQSTHKGVAYSSQVIVENGKLVEPSEIDIVIKPANVFGTLKRQTPNGIANVSNANLQISKVGGSWYNITVTNGNWDAYLEDGTYQMNGYWDQATATNYAYSSTFTVKDGHVEDEASVAFFVKLSNVNGTLKKQSDGALLDIASASLNLFRIGGNGLQVTVKNGHWDVYLEDGNYQVNGYWDQTEQVYVSLAGTFTVKDGKVTDPSKLNLLLRQSNIKGTLKKQTNAGIVNVDRANLNFHPVGGGMGSSVAVKNGAFTLFLADGTYQIDGYMDNSTEDYVPVNGQFVVENGALKNPNDLQIVVKMPNVSGTLKKQTSNGLVNVNSANLNMYKLGGGNGFAVSVKNGAFNLYLADGTYQVNGYWDQAAQENVPLTTTFKVENGVVTDASAVQFVVKMPNVNGTLKKQATPSNTNISNVQLNLYKQNGNTGFSVSVKNGQWSLFLEDGTYIINGYWDQMTQDNVPLNGKFVVENGKVTDANAIQLLVKESNVSGTLKKMNGSDKEDVKSAMLNLHPLKGGNGFSVGVKNGAFNLYLPDGTYQVDGYWDQNTQDYVAISAQFKVVGGQVDDPAILNLLVKPSNVNGTVKKQTSNGLENVTNANLNLYKVGGNGLNVSIKNGVFGVYLDDGNYQVNGYWDQATQENIPISVGFTVKDGEVTDPSKLQLVIKQANVTGTLKKQTDTGSTDVDNAFLNMYKEGGNGFGVSVKNGKFNLFLEDGNYKLNGYWDQNAQLYVAMNGSFTVSGGKVTNAAALQLLIKQSNVSGTLKKQTTGNATTNVSDANLNINSSDGTWYNVSVKDGKFDLYLPNGKYTFNSYWEQSTQSNVPVNQSFTVSGGKVTVAADVAIVVKKSNVTGTLKKQTKTGVVNLSDGVLNLHPKNANYGIGVSVKDGSYDLYLPDGEYQIEGYWDQNTQEFKSLPVTFEVSGGKVDQPDALNLIVKLDNVKGSAKVEGNGGATDLESAWLNLHPIGGNYGFGTKIKDGLWALYLEDGDYQVDGYWNEKTQEYTPVTVKFSVQNGAPTDESLLDLMIKSNNVSGTLKKQSGSSYVNVSNAWLNLHPVNGNVGMNASVKNGVFALYLPDGDYQVEGYWDQVNQVYVPVTATFTVDNGKLTDIKALDLKVRENNVTGILKNDAGAALSNAWLNITQINGDTRANVPVKNGAFELYLPNGKYQVDGYWDAENEVYVPMTTKFEVKNGVLVGSAPLKLAPNKINVSGTLSKDDGDGPYALTDVWVNISNPDTGELFTVLVNEGEFSLYLPNGNYDIDGYFNEATGEFVSLLGSFEVAGGKVTDETESELTIVSQNSNIEGTVEDASGDTLDGVWMTLVEENGEGTEDDRQINVYVEDGKFDAFLDDNTYTMDGYWSEDGETYTELDGTFTVDGGEVADDGGGIVEDAQQ